MRDTIAGHTLTLRGVSSLVRAIVNPAGKKVKLFSQICG